MRNKIGSVVLILIFLFITACSQDDHLNEPETDTYEIKNIEFFFKEDDYKTYSIDRLDTITYINSTDIQKPDTTINPFESLKDTLSIKLNSQDTIIYKDSLLIRQMIVNSDNTVVYDSQDTVSIHKFPSELTLPLRNINESVVFKPNPRTRYDIIGEYWRVKYSISFQAEVVKTKTHNTINLEGKLHYSIARIKLLDEQEEEPLTISILGSELP